MTCSNKKTISVAWQFQRNAPRDPKKNPKNSLEKERFLDSIESLFISAINFYGKFKKFFCIKNTNVGIL
ncbi:uncharacterized protein DS421_2g46560 [Arachis hypogaea]|nr:uncharacterized protein DS421_2g46560 [Arachis hypogaea]